MGKDLLNQLKEKCLLFNQFMIDKMGGPAGALVAAFETSNKLIEKAYHNGDIEPLKAMDKDINDQVKSYMPLQDVLELKKIFKDKLGIDVEAVNIATNKAIEKIVKRGKIVTPLEYDLLLNRVDEIFEDPAKENEVRQINRMLAAYHQ